MSHIFEEGQPFQTTVYCIQYIILHSEVTECLNPLDVNCIYLDGEIFFFS